MLASRYLWTAGVILLLAVIIGVLEGVGISLLIPLLSTFTQDFARPSNGGPIHYIQGLASGHSRNGRMLIVSAVLLTFVLLKSAFQIVANNFTVWVNGRVADDIRRSLASRLLGLGYSFFLTQEPARLINILNMESWKASEAVQVLLTGIANGAAVCVFGVLLVVVSWRLSLLVIVGGLVTRMLQGRGERRLHALSAEAVTANQQLVDRGLFTVFGARVIRLFNSQSAEQSQFNAESNAYRQTVLRSERLAGTQGPVLEALHGVLFLVVLVAAVFSGVSLPVLAAFLVLMNRLQPHLRLLEHSSSSFAAAAAHFDEVEWLLEPEGKALPPAGSVAFESFTQQIEFSHVSFDYGDRGEPALGDASFTLRRGRHLALLGTSGAGKSTLICLLCRLLDPTSGIIFVDGVPLTSLRPADWLKVLAVSGQDVDLVDGTIAENIRYGRPEIEDETVAEAARAAHADFIAAMPQQLQTLVGPRGLSLSGGQRQRIGIARALARNPQILILDEATNALDAGTEEAVFRTLRTWSKPVTIIVISHKVTNLRLCDDFILLERGRVAQVGPMAELWTTLPDDVQAPYTQGFAIDTA